VLIVLILGVNAKRECTAHDINAEGLEHAHGGKEADQQQQPDRSA